MAELTGDTLEAVRQWIAEDGRYPGKQEWEYQGPGRPTTRTINGAGAGSS